MKQIKEVTVFTNGDSSKISTWSNIPYFFTKTLLSKGVVVNRVDISPSLFNERIFNRTFRRIWKMINRNSTYEYFRSLINFTHVRYRIKKAIRKYPNSDANIFITFSFASSGLTKKPIVQFCDWTYDYYFKYFLDREPDFFEKKCIKREDSQIEGSDIVISLFPSVAEYMKNNYMNEHIYYLGNVVNNSNLVSKHDALSSKKDSGNILFVGSVKYIEGAKALINAFEKLKQGYPHLNLHIIGMNANDFTDLPDNVFCYGYLDKGIKVDQELYYRLFREAKVFVNTNPKWGAFSASVEAMYSYIPIITSPYKDFVETFGSNINFGYYCEENSPEAIEKSIVKILNHESYESLCLNAHEAVKDYTWDIFIDTVLEKIEDKVNS